MPAEEIEFDRSYTDLNENCLQKFDVPDSVPASGAHGSLRLMSPVVAQPFSFNM